ncbi:unnamed protein product [Toxocara canis]|uniref:UDP-glucuronosyltransferase n=1 Tax=Toxocara canis TaxID=6265 RepID=A0A3P7III0_TOXCA|nr:unnamed protein product [Toxocara canis]
MMRRLKDEKFDLGISEAFSFCGFGVFDKIGLQKHLSAFNTEIFEAFTEPYGISYNPSHVPGKDLFCILSRNLPFQQILKERIILSRSYLSCKEILANCPFIFVNTNILFEFPRELNSKIVFVSGISASQSNSLDEDFQRLMDASTGGVVLVSFGTIALSSQMPPDLKSAFVSAFQHFPEITFIWKYELDDEVASDLPNVIKRKWVPQSALLGHRNMRAFISHCGTNGLSESVNAGIPMVCVPLFFDQIRSAKKLEKQHTAFIIHKHNLTAQSLQWAIRTILYEKSYSISARRLSAMTKDVMIPLEEQINRHAKVAINMRKVEKLDPSGRRLNYFQFFLVDLTAIPLILIILLGANLCDL